jgi:hypothetical protein
MAKKRWITAEELVRQLESDPEWLAQRAARDARHAARAKRLAADEASLVAELRSVGVPVTSVGEFVGKQIAPMAAIPVLLRHLDVEHMPVIREMIIRALGVPGARQMAFDRLCRAYCEERDPSIQWLIANALSGMARLEELSALPGIEKYAGLFVSAP